MFIKHLGISTRKLLRPIFQTKLLLQFSTLSPEIRKTLKNTGNVDAAKVIGAEIAKAAIKVGVKQVAFDRSGYPYHGRIKALAEKAREEGLQF